MTHNDSLAFGINAASGVVLRYTEDLSPQEMLHRVVPEANCAAWIVGHLTLASRMMMRNAGVTDLPPLPDGYEQRFAFGEASKSADYGDLSTLRDTFRAHHERFAQLAATIPADRLDAPLAKPHPLFATVGQMLAFVPVHVAMHAGQISTIRRTLGRPALF